MRVGPQRIHVEDDVAAAVAGAVRMVFAPVGRVADLAAGADDAFHSRGEALELLDGRIDTVAGGRPQPGHPTSSEPMMKLSTPPASTQRLA